MRKLALISFSAAALPEEFTHFSLLEHGNCIAAGLFTHRGHGCLLS
jgi:hypothetical protein